MFESPRIFQRPMIEMVDGTGHFSEIISGKKTNIHCFLDKLVAVFGKPILEDLFHDKKKLSGYFDRYDPRLICIPMIKRGGSRFLLFILMIFMYPDMTVNLIRPVHMCIATALCTHTHPSQHILVLPQILLGIVNHFVKFGV